MPTHRTMPSTNGHPNQWNERNWLPRYANIEATLRRRQMAPDVTAREFEDRDLSSLHSVTTSLARSADNCRAMRRTNSEKIDLFDALLVLRPPVSQVRCRDYPSLFQLVAATHADSDKKLPILQAEVEEIDQHACIGASDDSADPGPSRPFLHHLKLRSWIANQKDSMA